MNREYYGGEIEQRRRQRAADRAAGPETEHHCNDCGKSVGHMTDDRFNRCMNGLCNDCWQTAYAE